MKAALHAALCLLVFMLNPASAKTGSGPQVAIRVPPTTAQKWTLPNGLTIIVQEDKSAPVASVQAWCETGSIDEDKHMGAGLSHILEHMLFKGTETRSTNQIAQKIQDAGGYINAYTSHDRTVYWIDIPSKGVETALDILSDAMMNSTLPENEYSKEQEVIRREFAMGYDDPDRMATQELLATAYSEHPYKHPVIGHLDVYNRLRRNDVMTYYKARYVPNNLFFVVVGDVDAQKVRAQLEKYFEKYPRQSLAPVYIPSEPPQLGRRDAHREFPTELTRLEMAWHIPALTHPDVPALDLLSLILGSGRSSRLYSKIREQLGLVHQISAFSYTPAQAGLFGVGAVLDPDKREQTEKVILEMLEDVKRNGVTEAELLKAKKQSLSSHLDGLTTMRGKASDLGSNWLLTRNLDFSNAYLESLQKVTVDDLKRVAGIYLRESNMSVVSLNPPGTLAKNQQTEKSVMAGEIQRFELANGLRLLVREDPRLPLVSTVAVFKAGLLAESPEDNGITRLFSKTLLKGTKSRSAEQIADQIEAVGGSIGSDAGNNSTSVSVRVMKPDLKTGLQILADVLINPTFPDKAVDREKSVQLASIKAEDEEMTSIGRNLVRSKLFPGHPYGLRNSGSPESLAKIDRAALVDFHRKYMVAKNGVIAVFGDVKAQEVKALVEEMLKSMPSGEAALLKPTPVPELSGELQAEAIKDKAQAILMVGYQGTDIFNPDRQVLELIDQASSDLGSRFFIRIREQMGLAYFVGTSQTMGLVPGPFVFYLGTSPEKAEAVRKELLAEIDSLAKEGLTAEELARAKEKILGEQDIQQQSNDAFAQATALDELYGLGFAHYKEARREIEAVSLEDTKRVANKYFLGKGRVIALVHPAVPAAAAPEKK